MRRLILVACLVGWASPVWAGNYLVSDEFGNDANSCAGSVESALPDFATALKKTIVSALTCVVAGDAITLIANRNGTATYYGGANNVVDSAIASITTGALGAPVTIQAWQGHYSKVILRPPDGSSAIAIRTTKAYLIFKNLVIDGSLQTKAVPPCLLSGGANNITFTHVEIKNSLAEGCIDSGVGTANTFRRSFFHNNAGDGLKISTASAIIRDNEFYSNGGDGFDGSGANTADTMTIERNRSYSNTGYGFVIGDNAGGNGNLARNNLSYLNGNGVQLQGTSNDWSNNVSYNNTGTGIKVDAGATNSLVKNNIAYLNGTNITDSGTTSTLTTNQTTNPTFNNAAGGDFTLADASTARNAGTTLGTVTRDYRMYPRPQGSAYDIGAYEMPDGCPAGVCTVSSGVTADLQTALFQAKCGETIKLTDGGDYADGPIIIPSKNPCTTYTTITRTGTLPAIYDVLGGCYVKGPTQAAEIAQAAACKAAMKTAYETNAPKITTTTAQGLANQGVAVVYAFDADYWKWLGVHIRSTNTNNADFGLTGFLIAFGFDGTDVTATQYGHSGDSAWTQTQQPDHLIFDRVSLSSIGSTLHGIYGEGSNVQLINSLCYGMKTSIGETDSQCYIAGQSPGPFLFDNNFLEASGENILFGGTGTLFWGMQPCDIIQRNNYMTKDWTWWTLASQVGAVYGGVAFTVKNVTECKNCCRNQIYNNVIENAWYVNVGDLALFQAVSNGDGNFWATVNDIEIWGNVFRHGGEAIAVSGKGGQNGGATQASNINMHDNLMYDIARTYNFNLAYVNTPGVCFAVFSNSSIGFEHSALDRITYNHNTCDNEGIAGQLYAVPDDRFSNLTITNNLFRGRGGASDPGGAYNWAAIQIQSGIDGLALSLDLMAPASYTVTNNAMFSAAVNTGWPAGNWVIVLADYNILTEWIAVFVNRAGFDYTVAPASVYKALNANDATDNKDLGADMGLLPLGGGGSSPPLLGPKLRLPFIRASREAPQDIATARLGDGEHVQARGPILPIGAHGAVVANHPEREARVRERGQDALRLRVPVQFFEDHERRVRPIQHAPAAAKHPRFGAFDVDFHQGHPAAAEPDIEAHQGNIAGFWQDARHRMIGGHVQADIAVRLADRTAVQHRVSQAVDCPLQIGSQGGVRFKRVDIRGQGIEQDRVPTQVRAHVDHRIGGVDQRAEDRLDVRFMLGRMEKQLHFLPTRAGEIDVEGRQPVDGDRIRLQSRRGRFDRSHKPGSAATALDVMAHTPPIRVDAELHTTAFRDWGADDRARVTPST